MSLPASRVLVRRTQALRFKHQMLRHSSTTSEAAQTASSGASKATSRASEGLTRVTSAAGPAISGAARGLGRTLSGIGGRTGRFIGFVESMIPPTVYYSKVGFELSKIVFRGQKMSPPDLATFQHFFQPVLNGLRNPTQALSSFGGSSGALNPSNLLNTARNVNRQQLAVTGVIAAELLGFFTAGQMLGRLKIVGYRGGNEHH